MNIPVENLPVLIVTNDFRSSEYLWYKTCPKYLEKQLDKLGYIAERQISKDNLNSLDIVLDSGLDLCDGHEIMSLEHNLAKALSDILSFIVAEDEKNIMSNIASNQARKTILELYIKLQKLKETHGLEENFDRLCISIASFLSNLSRKEIVFLHNDIFSVNPTFIENDSY